MWRMPLLAMWLAASFVLPSHTSDATHERMLTTLSRSRIHRAAFEHIVRL